MKIQPSGWSVTVFGSFRAREKRCRQCRWSVSVCLNPCSISVWPRPGLFPPVSSYRSGSVALQKHLNLRWQECVQLISSTVAPSSGSVLPTQQHHRRTRHRGAVPVRPVSCQGRSERCCSPVDSVFSEQCVRPHTFSHICLLLSYVTGVCVFLSLIWAE